MPTKTFFTTFLLITLFIFSFNLTPAYAKLNQSQIQSIINLLIAFNVDKTTIDTVKNILEGKNTAQITTTNNTNTIKCPNLTRTLYIGKKGEDVKQLQKFLKSLGYFNYPEFTNYFGKVTREAVRKYQCKHMNICQGTEATTGYGVVGPRTRESIRQYCTINNTHFTTNNNTANNVSANNVNMNNLDNSGNSDDNNPREQEFLFTGYYISVDEYSEVMGGITKTCNNFVITNGPEDILDYLKQLIKEGNSINTLTDEGFVQIGLPWEEISDSDRKIIQNSDKQNQITLRLKKKDIKQGIEVGPCYSFFHFEGIISSDSCKVGNKEVKSGESIKLYSVQQSYQCEQYSQVRTCENGVLTGDDGYKYLYCSTPLVYGGGGGASYITYNWKADDWSLCKDGIQKRTVVCSDSHGNVGDDSKCDTQTKPADTRACYPQKETIYTMLNELYSMIFGKPLKETDAKVTTIFNQIKQNAELFDKYNPHFDSTTHFILRTFYNWLFYDPQSQKLHGKLANTSLVSDTEFISKAYQIILNRNPSSQEKNEALNLLSKGYSRLEIARRILMSDESREKHARLFESEYLRDPLAFEGVGPFIGPSMAQRVEPFLSNARLVGAYIYRWYDYESKAHVCIPESLVAPERKSWVKEWLTLDNGKQCAVILTHRPPSYTNPLFSNKSKEYWKKQFRDMHDAGIDIAIFSGDFGLPYLYPIENRMKYYYPINQALDELYKEGVKVKVAMMLEPMSWRHSTVGNSMFSFIDLRHDEVREFIYKQARDFYSNIDPKHWAVIDGKVAVYTWRPFDFITNANDAFKNYFDRRFKEDFGIDSNILFGDATYYISGKFYKYPWAGISAKYRYSWGAQLSPDAAWVRNNIAQVSPGFDNSLSAAKLRDPKQKPLIVSRENGAFYKKAWDTVYANPQVNLVLIGTWDELHEARGISETREFGRKYINATRNYVDKWRSMKSIEKQAVYAAYKTILKRAPDPSGLQTYENKLKQRNISFIQLLWILFNSQEFANKFNGGKLVKDTTDEEYVRLVYKTLLLRDPDTQGFNNYVNKLGSGVRTRYEVFDIVLNSGEFADKHPFYPYLKQHYRDLIR